MEYNGTTYRVTSIGSSAFEGCTGLTELTIPNSVTSIGSDAFYGCTGLTELTIGNSVTSIGSSAFSGCTGLTELTIGNSVTSIGWGAFRGCTVLTEVTIPNSVTSIGNYAFEGCTGLTELTIGNSVTSIGSNAFYGCTGLTELTIPNSVTSIGSSAFSGCTGLTDVTIADGTETLSLGGSFYNCLIKTLYLGRNFSGSFANTSIETLTIGDCVTSIGDNAFSYTNLGHITVEDGNPNYDSRDNSNAIIFTSSNTLITGGKNTIIPTSVISIGSNAFSGRTGLTEMAIPTSVTSIGSNAFSGCTGLTEMTIPESVTSIGTYAFSGCTNLTSLTFNAANCSSCGSSSSTAFPSTISNLTIGDKVTKIPNYFLYNGSKIENLVIPNSVTSIGDYAFCDNKLLKSLTLGSGLLTIGSKAFSYSYYDYNSGTSFKCIDIAKAFWLGNTPPSGYDNVSAKVNYVSNSQYTMNNRLQYQFLSSMFEVDGVKYIPVSPSDRTCDVVDCIYTGDYKDITISDKVTNKGVVMSVLDIKQYAFYGNGYTQSLNLSNVGKIGDYAFDGCKNILEATLGENVTGIGDSAFSGCSALKDFVIPDSVKSLGSSVFQDCSSLASVSIGTGIPSLPSYTFSGCSSLGSLFIPNNIYSIGSYAFYGCSSLGDITIEDADKEDDKLTLGSNGSNPLFSDCPLDEVYIGRKLSYQTGSSYGYSPFYRNTKLRTVEITDAETQIYDNEFYGCTNLNSLKIGNGVKTIGNWAFSGCSSLDYFSAGNHVGSIGKEAFSDCTGLTKYYSYSAVPPVCGDQALDDINKWECILYVPAESSDEYQAAAQWKDFFFVEDAILVTEILLNMTEATLDVDETIQLTAEILTSYATDRALVWSSSDNSVATVENGLVTAIAEGNAVITVRSKNGNAEATCSITVNSKQDTGIDDVVSETHLMTVRANDKTIMIEGKNPQDRVDIYNVQGSLVESTNADKITLSECGIFIVRIGNVVYKIRL